MSIPTNFTDVAWYNGGPRPGMPGSAVIDGHLDGQYVQRAVFYNLQNLKVGDAVKVVDASGTTFTFQVVASKAYAYNASTTDIFSNDTSKARLNLITCTGDWIKSQKLYNQRIVVFTELVGSSR
jgi:LPXTG-site transpeptidase (sortase) family protein